jgi:hypothetical protein
MVSYISKKDRNLMDKKFIETFDVNDWEVATETGWVGITHTNKTIEYKVWEVKVNGLSKPLRCADNHILFRNDYSKVFVKDLVSGDKIVTASGPTIVEYVKELDYSEEMYDLSVDSELHGYLTDGILSHNTTIVAVFALWYGMFNNDKTVAILAQQLDGAIEMVDRVKLMLEYLPPFMKPGVKLYNKKTIVFENNCKIFANATTGKAVRGKSINCQTGDAVVTIKDNVTGEIENLTFEEVEDRLLLLQEGFDPTRSKVIDLSDKE